MPTVDYTAREFNGASQEEAQKYAEHWLSMGWTYEIVTVNDSFWGKVTSGDMKQEPKDTKVTIVGYQTRDSGDRTQYASGMVRDRNDDKTRYDLVIPKEGVCMFDRWAELLTRGAAKYAARNWEKANSQEEYEEFIQSAWRHFRKWDRGDQDEDHAAAVFFNIQGAEYVRGKLEGI